MNTKHHLNPLENHAACRLGWLAALAGAVMISAAPSARAAGSDPASGRIAGIYKVASSTDPMFPATRTQEYFLDFGPGLPADKLSGSVAVSLRRNPKVQVRIMAWQYFPEQGAIALGNPFAAESRNAVVRGAWRIRGIANGVVFQRGNYQVVLRRADPQDY